MELAPYNQKMFGTKNATRLRHSTLFAQNLSVMYKEIIMKNLLALSLTLFIAGCEITVQDPSMMEINGGSLSFKDKVELIDTAILNLKSSDLESTIINTAKVTDLTLIKNIDVVKIVQNDRVFLKCDIDAKSEVELKLEAACRKTVMTEMMKIVKETKNT